MKTNLFACIGLLIGAFVLISITPNYALTIAPESESHHLGYKHGQADGDYDGYHSSQDKTYMAPYHWALDTTLDEKYDFSKEIKEYIDGYRAGYKVGYDEGYTRGSSTTTNTEYKKGYDKGYADAVASKSYNPFADQTAPSTDYLNGYHAGYFAGMGTGEETEAYKKGYKLGYQYGVADASVNKTPHYEEVNSDTTDQNTWTTGNIKDYIRGKKDGYADGTAHVKETMAITSTTTAAEGNITIKFSDQSTKMKGFNGAVFYYPYKTPDMWVEMSADGKKQVVWTREKKTTYISGEKWVSTDGRIHYVFSDGSWYQYYKDSGAWTRYDATHRVMWNSQGDVIWYHSDGKRCIFYSKAKGVKYYILGKEVTKAEYDAYNAPLTASCAEQYRLGYNEGWTKGYTDAAQGMGSAPSISLEGLSDEKKAYWTGYSKGYADGQDAYTSRDQYQDEYQAGQKAGYTAAIHGTNQNATANLNLSSLTPAERMYWYGWDIGYLEGSLQSASQ
ncbi:MAG: hypothetical protein ACOY3I_00685 [Verrucomicrobiota bacterium]